ncbi:MarR family winged helix-turn-helix transcriptional regulator [Streptomyces sp. LHD-70]|uniref:MarR family winged helix-turn-helix transcriptional regulator n=1 Tax=Streptomyces sp. LHD-70 TaxID=3072140 RepID=UPI002810678A|nr:MarR family winged helix-turn-helix transcriptional regulator [Streptomyces sp. LHD-70]MDQ8705929.1 MarR family winged helix-turn-helix transcriptional regulator [Streptomyces sp. LHD-70]
MATTQHDQDQNQGENQRENQRENQGENQGQDQEFHYTHDDAGLLNQPIGYWSWAANKAVIDYIRAGLTEVGLTQPQWWVISQVREGARPREDVFTMLRGYLDVGDALRSDIDELIERGILATADEESISLTDTGHDLLERATARQRKSLARIHEGVPDADFLTTLKVLQRMIHNTGGKAWHH